MSDLLIIIFYIKENKINFLALLLWALLYVDSMKHDSYFWVQLSLYYCLISRKCLDSMTEF